MHRFRVNLRILIDEHQTADGGSRVSVYRPAMHNTRPTWWPKKWHHFLYALSSSNINRFSKFFHCQHQEKICSNTITKDPTTPQVCRYTTLWNVRLLKATIENKTSVTTHFKKLTTGNNVFIVSVIVSKVAQLSHLQFLHQVFNVSTLLLEDATDQWRDQWNAFHKVV